jgi:hypothetical protein
MRGLGLVGLAIIFVLAFAVNAGATTYPYLSPDGWVYGTVTATYLGSGQIRTYGTINIWGASYQYGLTAYGGVYMFSKGAAEGMGIELGTNSWNQFGGLCIEMNQSRGSTATYNVMDLADAPLPVKSNYGTPMGDTKAQYLSELWAERFDTAWVSVQSPSGLTSAQKKAAEAFSACVWEIIYEPLPATPAGWDVTTDGSPDAKGFKCSHADTTLANSWLYALDGNGGEDVWALSNPTTQDMMVMIPIPITPDNTVIPEPVTMAGLMLGIGGLVTYVRKRRTA